MKQASSGKSFPCRHDPSRVDATGRAYAGSQRQIQSYVNDCPRLLNQAVMACLPPGRRGTTIKWMSPLRTEGYMEYRDSDFLRRLGLARLILPLQGFWPPNGPCWDALGRYRVNGSDRYLLIEDKSHPPGIYGNGCRAAGPSLTLIEQALANTKRWLRADHGAKRITLFSFTPSRLRAPLQTPFPD